MPTAEVGPEPELELGRERFMGEGVRAGGGGGPSEDEGRDAVEDRDGVVLVRLNKFMPVLGTEGEELKPELIGRFGAVTFIREAWVGVWPNPRESVNAVRILVGIVRFGE